MRYALPQFSDYLALYLLKLSKLGRKNLASTEQGDCAKFYEQFFEQKDMESYDEDPRMVMRRETIIGCLRAIAPSKSDLLDIGCGLGDVLAGMIHMPYRLHGFDYSEFNIRIARRRLGVRALIEQGHIYKMPFPTASMDCCLCLEVLEHIEDDARAVREIHRILKPGGWMIAAVPYTYYWPQYLPLMGHFRHYTRESFKDLLEMNGFVCERYLPNYPNWHQTFTRRYVKIRAQAITIGRLLRKSSAYDFRWPWQRQTAIQRLQERLKPLLEFDSQLDYAKESTSTFVLARRPA